MYYGITKFYQTRKKILLSFQDTNYTEMYAYTENILDGKKRVADTSTNQIETFICYDICNSLKNL